MLQKCDSKTNVKNGLPQIHATVHFHERDEIRTHDLPLRSRALGDEIQKGRAFPHPATPESLKLSLKYSKYASAFSTS